MGRGAGAGLSGRRQHAARVSGCRVPRVRKSCRTWPPRVKSCTARPRSACRKPPTTSSRRSRRRNDELRDKIEAARQRIASQVAKNAEQAHDAVSDTIPVSGRHGARGRRQGRGQGASAADAVKDNGRGRCRQDLRRRQVAYASIMKRRVGRRGRKPRPSRRFLTVRQGNGAGGLRFHPRQMRRLSSGEEGHGKQTHHYA